MGLMIGGPRSPSFAERLERSLFSIGPVIEADGAVRITTQCMYPSNGLVRVTVRGGIETVVVSDEGEALGEAFAAGIEIHDPDKLLRAFVKQQGLILSKGIIHTGKVPIEGAGVAVLHVANAAKDAASWLYEHNKIKRTRDFRKMLSEFLADVFKEQVAETKIVGASNKSHKFANVISFANGRKLIVDAVANDASSINSRVVANLDIKSSGDRTIEQRIVYDDSERWSAADLNLLKVGATVVPFSRAHEVIRRIADEARAA
jgi:hypothetical protein